jgi:GTP-binding protein
LRLVSVDFVTSAAPGLSTGSVLTGIPRDGVAQVAFVGRSNVGKSSLINALSRAKIARTSAAPGKTRLANVFRLVVEAGPGGPGRWSVYFVDLPGYGYARRSTPGQARHRPEPGRETRASLRAGPVEGRSGTDDADELRSVAEGYFRAAVPGIRRAAILLVDSRHPGLEADSAAAHWLDGLNVTRHVVATKIDKLSRAERARSLRAIENVFGMTAVPVSVTSGEGLDALWTMIARIARDVQPRG